MNRAMNSPKQFSKDSPAKIRPDEKEDAPADARMRGSMKKLSSRGKRKSRKHSRRR